MLGEDRLLKTQPEVVLYSDSDGKWPVNGARAGPRCSKCFTCIPVPPFFIEIQFTYHNIHPLRAYNLVSSSSATKGCATISTT